MAGDDGVRLAERADRAALGDQSVSVRRVQRRLRLRRRLQRRAAAPHAQLRRRFLGRLMLIQLESRLFIEFLYLVLKMNISNHKNARSLNIKYL